MNSSLLAALIASGATTTSVPSAWREALVAAGAADGQLGTFLKQEGYSGSVADMFFKYLGDKGYVGTLSDRISAAAVASDLFTAPKTYATWSVTDRGAPDPDPVLGNPQLTNGLLTSYAAGGWVAVRATIGKTTGDWFYTDTMDSGSYTAFGFAAASQRLSYHGDGGDLGFGVSSHGYNISPSGIVSNGVTFGAGDVIGCALLRSTSRLKFYKLVAGSWSLIWNADISSADGIELFPMFSGLNGTGTANFGASAFPAAVPDGCHEGVFS